MGEQLALEAKRDTAVEQITPQSLIQLAMSDQVDPAKLQALMDFAERYQAAQAKNAFNEAFSAFKKEAIRIVKNVDVKDGPLKGKKYADLFGVTDVLIPILSKHGLTHSWKLSKDEPQWMEVTCTLRHDKGHSESVSMGSAPDTGPGRNAIQARMSSVSYLERYTLLAVTGTAAAGTDNDGNGPKEDAGKLPDNIYDEWLSAIQGAANDDDLKKTYLDALAAADKAKDSGAARAFADEKNKRFRAFRPTVKR